MSRKLTRLVTQFAAALSSNWPFVFRVGSVLLFIGLFPLLTLSTLAGDGAPPHPAGALRVEGVAEYEVFSISGGKSSFSMREEFSFTFQGQKWLATTRFLESMPPRRIAELFAPPYQQMSSDGEDLFDLELMSSPNGSSNWWTTIEPGHVPANDSPTVMVVWLAFCAGSELPPRGGNGQLKPFAGASITSKRWTLPAVPVTFVRSRTDPAFIDRLDYISDGRIDLGGPDYSPKNMRSPPWDVLHTNSIFQVISSYRGRNPGADRFTNMPAYFKLEGYSEGTRSNRNASVLFFRIQAKVTNVVEETNALSWLPALPSDQRVLVKDYRFDRDGSGGGGITYDVTNNWKTRSDPTLIGYPQTHPAARATAPGRLNLFIAKYLPWVRHARFVRNRSLFILVPGSLLFAWFVFRFARKPGGGLAVK